MIKNFNLPPKVDLFFVRYALFLQTSPTPPRETCGLRPEWSAFNTPLYVTIRQTAGNIDDTRMLAGNEACHASLTFYNAVKGAAADDVPGAKSVYEALKARFPHVKHNRNGETVSE
jgi:hypothetical protein